METGVRGTKRGVVYVKEKQPPPQTGRWDRVRSISLDQ